MGEYKFSVAFPLDGGAGSRFQDVVIRPHKYGDPYSVTIELPVGIVEAREISLPRDMFSDKVLELVK